MKTTKEEPVELSTLVKDTDRAWVTNYPPLHAWIKRIKARCLAQVPRGDPLTGGYLETYVLPNGKIFLLIVTPFQGGWEIYTPLAAGDDETRIHNAEVRLGLVRKP